MEEYFHFDARLGIPLPAFKQDWDHFPRRLQHDILLYWEKIRGSIPDRIAELEHKINSKQAELNDESNFDRSCRLNSEIAELASIINDLWLWYRTHQEVTGKVHQ
ncbi:ABC transporter C-terminal domain-containing protein [Mesobacillus foraminis]|uniref:ABC transporter C-terminal domain-containing protein n=1 Tax=Mesobacillus foraminis TaxID=279826 RepID=UPI000EF475CA|nr:ABC transporter C-terminal domain-containing protein [Mesobacillus foraminis]